MQQHQKIFVVTDVHGHYTLLKQALDNAGFDAENSNYLLVCCGDYFDRGSENVQVLKFFERLPRKVLLRGNHEDMLLKLLESGKVLPHHYINGTMQTLRDFFGNYCIDPTDDSIDFSGKTRTVDRLCDFIYETVDYFETQNYVFVHGWLPDSACTPEARQQASAECWAKARWKKWIEHYDGTRPLPDKTLVCGHVPAFFADAVDKQRDPKDCTTYCGNGIIALDAGTFDSHHINVLILEE